MTYFLCKPLHSLPIQPWKHIFNEDGIHVDFDLLELCIFGMEREGCGGGFAGFAGAGEEIEGEEFHLGRPFILLYVWYNGNCSD